jgi:hypothetical protein
MARIASAAVQQDDLGVVMTGEFARALEFIAGIAVIGVGAAGGFFERALSPILWNAVFIRQPDCSFSILSPSQGEESEPQ